MSTALIIAALFTAFLIGGLLVAEYLCRRVETNQSNASSDNEPAPPNTQSAPDDRP